MWSSNVRRFDISLLPRRGGERGTGAATTIPSLDSYSNRDFTCDQPMDRDYLACLAWLALRALAQQLRYWSAAWLASPGEHEGPVDAARTDYPSLRAHPTPLPGLVCSAGPQAQAQSLPIIPKNTSSRTSPAQSFTHRSLDVRPGYARSLVPWQHLRPKIRPALPDGMDRSGAFSV